MRVYMMDRQARWESLLVVFCLLAFLFASRLAIWTFLPEQSTLTSIAVFTLFSIVFLYLVYKEKIPLFSRQLKRVINSRYVKLYLLLSILSISHMAVYLYFDASYSILHDDISLFLILSQEASDKFALEIGSQLGHEINPAIRELAAFIPADQKEELWERQLGDANLQFTIMVKLINNLSHDALLHVSTVGIFLELEGIVLYLIMRGKYRIRPFDNEGDLTRYILACIRTTPDLTLKDLHEDDVLSGLYKHEDLKGEIISMWQNKIIKLNRPNDLPPYAHYDTVTVSLGEALKD